jgi:hypothetical protein
MLLSSLAGNKIQKFLDVQREAQLMRHKGIQVSPNSSRILRKLGVDKYIEKYCSEPVDLRMMRWRDGKVLVECPLKEPAHSEYGSPYW